MIIASLREKLSNPTTIAQEPFGVLREISTLLNQGDEVGCREAVLRALEHRAAFGQLETVLLDRKSTRLNSSHMPVSRMPSSA